MYTIIIIYQAVITYRDTISETVLTFKLNKVHDYGRGVTCVKLSSKSIYKNARNGCPAEVSNREIDSFLNNRANVFFISEKYPNIVYHTGAYTLVS
jgi:hypothetical protein